MMTTPSVHNRMTTTTTTKRGVVLCKTNKRVVVRTQAKRTNNTATTTTTTIAAGAIMGTTLVAQNAHAATQEAFQVASTYNLEDSQVFGAVFISLVVGIFVTKLGA